MRYVLFDLGNDECTIVTEEGGVACAHNNGDHIVSEYYQDALSRGDLECLYEDETIWDILGQGKLYSNDWAGDKKDYPLKTKIDDEVVKDLREWLCPDETDFTEYRMKWDDDYAFLKTFLKDA